MECPKCKNEDTRVIAPEAAKMEKRFVVVENANGVATVLPLLNGSSFRAWSCANAMALQKCTRGKN